MSDEIPDPGRIALLLRGVVAELVGALRDGTPEDRLLRALEEEIASPVYDNPDGSTGTLSPEGHVVMMSRTGAVVLVALGKASLELGRVAL